MIFSSILTLIVFFSSFAQSKSPSVCNIPEPGILIKTDVPESVNYFFKAFPSGDLVSYNGDNVNYVLNLSTGEKFSVPGIYDPVPLFDGKVITTTIQRHGIFFYPIHQNHSTKESELIFRDQDFNVTYQSIGELSKDSVMTKYRMIGTDENAENMYLAEYIVSNSQPVKINRTKLIPNFCSKDVKLPMISKDGNHLAGRDQSTDPPHMKIYSITSQYECKEIIDLGLSTGKVDFSFDGKKVAFHIDTMNTLKYFMNPSDVVGGGSVGNMNVFEMDLRSKKIKQLSYSGSESHSYFPTYKRDGTIVFLRRVESNPVGQYSFMVIDPKKIKGIDSEELMDPIADLPSCSSSEQKDALAALGQAWYKLCAKVETSKEQGFILGSLLTKEKCIDLLQNYSSTIELPSSWKFKKEDLIKLCGNMSNLKPKQNSTTIKKVVTARLDAETIFQNKCLGCHMSVDRSSPHSIASTPATQTPGAKNWKEAVPLRLNSLDEAFKMPKGYELSPIEKETLLKYLK